ncbi:hypothetical protein ACFSQ3_11660 [Sphingobacterium corticis]|uniref:Benenodin family lasso peptide n=1 Tax=Sphingobacterium corticis TaxID=1812823 RepID=A0ABW5NKI8_9SPHI
MKEKNKYTQPKIDVVVVEIENQIAAGSVAVSPVSENGTITDEYQNEEQTFDVNW